eukprot:6180414-Pleurochrysis_carterae.AAC.1
MHLLAHRVPMFPPLRWALSGTLDAQRVRLNCKTLVPALHLMRCEPPTETQCCGGSASTFYLQLFKRAIVRAAAPLR